MFVLFSDDKELPLSVSMAAKALLSADSHSKRAEVESAAGTWEGDPIKVSPFAATLSQLDNGVKVPPRGWKCQRCPLTTNLWMNLTDGAIHCGRRFFDGSGGNNHAVDHYQATQYPLAVKLGTITADGKADVFSYAEDDMVEDPHLKRHLAHFGINVTSMEKTDKSMVELEIDMNQRAHEWLTLTESGSKLVPVYGPGFTGMENLGNTCYMNSVMQVLFTLPAFKSRYVDGVDLDAVPFDGQVVDRFDFQMSKLGRGLWSGAYSSKPVEGGDDKEDGDRRGIRPTLFKQLIGRGHSEFSTKQQQDAQEFYLHLLTVMEREHKRTSSVGDPAFRGLQFEVEDRHECGLTQKVKYLTRIEDYLPFSIPVDMAVNRDRVDEYHRKKAEVEAKGDRMKPDELVRPRIPFAACLSKFLEEEQVQDFYSSAAKTKTFARKTMRLTTCPDHLLIQLKKFDIGENWLPYKLDVEVEMPDDLDLTSLLTQGGLKDGETLLPQEDDDAEAASAKEAFEPDPAIVAQLSEIFAPEACKKAAYHTKNAGAEAAMNWILEHMNDPDFNEPFVAPGSGAFVPDEAALANLMAMSFTKAQATRL